MTRKVTAIMAPLYIVGLALISLADSGPTDSPFTTAIDPRASASARIEAAKTLGASDLVKVQDILLSETFKHRMTATAVDHLEVLGAIGDKSALAALTALKGSRFTQAQLPVQINAA